MQSIKYNKLIVMPGSKTSTLLISLKDLLTGPSGLIRLVPDFMFHIIKKKKKKMILCTNKIKQ